MNPELSNDTQDRRPNPTFLRRIGETVVGISVAYVGVKIGQDLFNIELSHPVEMGISTAVGSLPINIRYANLERHNNQTEQ